MKSKVGVVSGSVEASAGLFSVTVGALVLMPNTTQVLPASTLEAVAHVLEAILLPSVVSHEVTEIVQSLPVEVSTSILVVQSGFVSDDIAAFIVVRSFP